MANDNFGNEDHVWKIQVGQRSIEEERDFWGDEYNWNSLSPILWGTVDHPRIRVQPPKARGDIYPIVSWWQGALHLLHFGLGWNDIARGLDKWRSDGYPTENHVLRAVFNTYGPSIEGLEVWMKRSSDYVGSMEASFYGLKRPLSTWHEEKVREQREVLRRQLDSGPRHQLTELLLAEEGNDNLHLSGHFPAVIREDQEFDNDPAWLYEDSYASVVLERYQGWHRLTVEGLEMFYGGLSRIDENFVVEVSVVGFGSLGRYAVSPQTGRLFRRSFGQGSLERDHYWHLAGY